MRRDLLLRHTPPEWNIKVLTQDDFDYYCDRAGIIVIEAPIELPGYYTRRNDQPRIYLLDDLRGAERLFIAFHELAHHWLHPPGVQMFHGLSGQVEDEIEDEADVVSVCCLIPATMLNHYWPSEIMQLHGYPEYLVKYRREVFDKWKI